MNATTSSIPLVSLVMPVWQTRRDWLRTAVNSALEQQGCRVELIVVDDGNSEPVTSLLDGITDARLRVVRIHHSGASAARNAGINEAQGDWIRFVDADDVLLPNSTSHLGSFMDGDEVIAYGGTLVCDEDLRPRRLIASALQGHVSSKCLLGQFDTRLPALLFPRSVVEAAGPWDATFPVSGDWDFVLRALDHARVAGDQQVALYYRRHTRSISGTASIAAGEDAWRRLITAYFERHPEQRKTSLPRQAWAAMDLDRGFAYWNAGEYGKSFKRLSRAFFYAPRKVGTQFALNTAYRASRVLRARESGRLD
jgi:glycosyltransferase involved in cell wall biosynthesis